MKIALVTYNSIFAVEKQGWITDDIFVIQDDNYRTWYVDRFGFDAKNHSFQQRGVSKIEKVIGNHWLQLAAHLDEFDMVFIYVGDSGSERTIKFAKQNRLDPEKATFVMCHCNEDDKKSLIASCGFSKSTILMCECGGQITFSVLYADLCKKVF